MKTIVINNIQSIKKNFLKMTIMSFGLLTMHSLFGAFTEQTTMAFRGQYDIKMVSSVGMQSAWLSQANPYVIHSAMTNEEMRSRGKAIEQNNAIGNPNAVLNVVTPVPAGAIGHNVVFTDCDDDMSTFQSSAAFLDFGLEEECTTVEAAYLYWTTYTGGSGANYAAYPGISTMRSYPGGTNVGATSGNAYRKVKFKAPYDGTYTEVTSAREFSASNRVTCFADVTNLVKGKGGGLYWVADLRCDIRSQAACAWSLIVIFRPPNCPPRTIKFWDGNTQEINGDTANMAFTFNFNTGEVPASGNSYSYLGISALDGENFASYLVNENPTNPPYDYLEFKSSAPGNNGSTFKINPFAPGQTAPFPGEPQPGYTCYNDKGVLISTNGHDGFSSSRISTWDPEKGTNGNEVVRLPNIVNTIGYDAHHLRLPVGAMVPGARTAVMTYYAGPQGGTTPIFAYMAIETLQPNLKLYKRAVSATTSTGNDLTYKLVVKNIGPLKAEAGSYVVDTLDLPVDFVSNSVQYYDKNNSPIAQPQPFVIQNQGADVNEYLKFYLPEIAAGVNDIAQDSVTIEFKVKVKGLDRMDIWSVGCRRIVKNKATVYYKTADGDDLVAGSNASVGCGGVGQHAEVKVDDQVLEDLYKATHEMDTTLSDKVNNANPKLKIVTEVKELLKVQLAKLNRDINEANLYTIFTGDGILVPVAEEMTNAEPIQTYIAYRNIGDDCEEEFIFRIAVAKVPKITIIGTDDTRKTSCLGAKDGTVTIRATEGDPVYFCQIVDPTDDNIIYYQSCGDASATTYDFIASNLSAGTYKIILMDNNKNPVESTFIITDPSPITVTLISSNENICQGSSASLNASVTGRPLGTPLTYVWKESVDQGMSWINTPSGGGTSLNPVISDTIQYQLFVCDGACQASSDVVTINAIEIPQVSVNPDDIAVSVNAATPPTAVYDAVISNYNPLLNYTYKWEVSKNNGSSWNIISGASVSGFDGSYAGYGSSQLVVSNIVLAMNDYKFRVTVSNQYNCTGTPAQAHLTVAEGPRLTPTITNASCDNISDGQLSFVVNDGEDNENYTINFYKGEYSSANPPIGQTPLRTESYNKNMAPMSIPAITGLEGKAAGTAYTAQVVPANTSLTTTYFTYKITAPAAVEVTLTAPSYACTGSSISLTANISGGPVAAGKSYVWSKSTDGITFDPMSETTASINTLLDQDYSYKVQGYVGSCTVNIGADPVKLVDAKALPAATIEAIPQIVVLSSPTGTFSVNQTAGDGDQSKNKYQWQISTDEGSSWHVITAHTQPGQYSNFTTANMSVSNVNLGMDGTLYKVLIESEFGCKPLTDPTAMLQVAKEPKITAYAQGTSCYGYEDGFVAFDIQDGEPGQLYAVNFYKGYFDKHNLPDTSTPRIASEVGYQIDGSNTTLPSIQGDSSNPLTAGWYTVIAAPVGGLQGLQAVIIQFEITQPEPFTVSLSAPEKVCEKANIKLEAKTQGGPQGEIPNYQWQVSTDGYNFMSLDYNTASIFYPSTEDLYFQVFAEKDICISQSNVVKVSSIPTPEIDVLPVDTGCFYFDLADLQVSETTGVSGYKLSLHSSMPKGATDNKYIISMNNYQIYKHMTVYAMLSVEDMCYSVAPVSVYIKNIEECYPIIVPKMFSPDGNNINDRFQIEGIEEYRNFNIKIFNRYGKKVFEGNKEQVMPPYGWDGKYNGNDLPSGDYWYRITADGIKEKQGTFSIKRGK